MQAGETAARAGVNSHLTPGAYVLLGAVAHLLLVYDHTLPAILARIREARHRTGDDLHTPVPSVAGLTLTHGSSGSDVTYTLLTTRDKTVYFYITTTSIQGTYILITGCGFTFKYAESQKSGLTKAWCILFSMLRQIT